MSNDERRLAAIANRKKTEQDYRDRAAQNLADHEYTCIVQQDNAVIWRCKAPKSTAYAFDIMMTRFGIAVVGDIDNLTFSVGMGYGIEFLGGDDVTYYLHTKLDERCKQREFSESLFREVLMRHVAMAVEEECGAELYESLPEWLQDPDKVRAAHWGEFRQVVLAARRDLENGDDRWMHWDELFDQIAEISSTTEAQIFMRDNEEALFLGPEWYENRVDEPAQSLIQRLYMINHAAKAILAQQAP
ncbi:hypothetical protein LZ023_26805 [Pseudomonas silvicola]|nr:hypothetical protein LZ023_26805 [Pseudomonas silvicola]